jgi:hypothetical protein
MIQSGNLPLETHLIFCNECNRGTNHICKFHEYSSVRVQSGEELRLVYADHPDLDIDADPHDCEINGYLLWACAGCDSWTIEYYFTVLGEGEDPLEFLESNHESYIPERTKFHVQAKQFHQLSPTLERIYREVLHSYNSDLPVLCGMGIRALIEGICNDQKILGKNVAQKIDGLSTLIPLHIVSNIHSLRFIGNEAAHDLISPDREELHLAISLVEDLFNYLYELDYRASSLSEWHKKKRASFLMSRKELTESDDISAKHGSSSPPSELDDE